MKMMKTLIQQTEQRSRGIKRAHCFPEAGRIFSVPQGPMCLELSLTRVNARQPRKKEDLHGPSLVSTRTPELWILLMLETGLSSAHLPESHRAHQIHCYEPLVPQQAPNQNFPLFLATEWKKKKVTEEVAKVGPSLVAQLVKEIHLQCRRPQTNF